MSNTYYAIEDSTLTNIADAIRAKGISGQMTPAEMPTKIASIPTGGASGTKFICAEGTYDVSPYANVKSYYLFPVRAYINTSNNYWAYYADASLSFCFPVQNGVRYTLKWSDEETGMYRIAFVKTTTIPYTNSTANRKSTFTASGASGIELSSTIATDREYSFTVSNSALLMCVVQVGGSNEMWKGDLDFFKDIISHLTITEG